MVRSEEKPCCISLQCVRGGMVDSYVCQRGRKGRHEKILRICNIRFVYKDVDTGE